MSPEEALALARERAAAARAAGRYVEPADEGELRVAPTDRIATERLMEWAFIEPDLDEVRSTRRFGGPITWVKRLQHRALRQYLAQLESQQSRFNMHVLVRVAELEDRIQRLEEG